MAFRYRDLELQTVGVVGSGQIGPDIALHFARVLAPHGVRTVVVDISREALARGEARLRKKVARGVQSGAFTAERAEALTGSVTFTDDDEALRGAGLVVEAATEDVGVKRRIFARLEELCGPGAILTSNSSHLEPEVIFAEVRHPGRTLVTHYFFPAERNLLVEIVPGAATAPAVAETVLGLYEALGKVPIRVGSRYGYAIDPIFEGLMLAACLLVEEGAGTTKEVDAVATRALGLTVGPFTAHNLTGGNPITDHGLTQMHEKFGPWWRSPRLLKEQREKGVPWEVPARGERVEVEPEREAKLRNALRGAYFGLVGQILASGITNVADLEMALALGLDIAPPFQLMNRLGVGEALRLVEAYAARHPGFPVPAPLREQAARGEPWAVPVVLRRDVDDVAVVTLRRPKALNALNGEVYRQLRRHFEAIREDRRIRAAVLTGFGIKAFAAGADIPWLKENADPEAAFRTCEEVKAVLALIENLGKPVVCALNGLAFGGGNELAMACHARLVRAGLKQAVAQPEPRLGLIPGAGATQRLPRLVGLEKAAEILRTARVLSGKEAVELGLVREEVTGDLLERAIHLAREAARGEVELRPVDPAPLTTPEELPPVDIGPLSRAVDRILCRAILEGCRRPLPEGLRFESEMFAACCRLEDMKIGVRHFLEHGPRTPAPFVHR